MYATMVARTSNPSVTPTATPMALLDEGALGTVHVTDVDVDVLEAVVNTLGVVVVKI